MKLLVTYNIPREPFQNLPADWEITFPEKEEFSKTELLRILPDYDIMLVRSAAGDCCLLAWRL